MDPAHGPPLQARVAAANGTVLQLANMLVWTCRSWRTWKEQGQQNERSKANLTGQTVEKGSGHGRQRVNRHTAFRTGTAGKHSQRILRPAQASKHTNGPQLAGRAAKTTAA